MGSVFLILRLLGEKEAHRHSAPSGRSELSYFRVQFRQFLRAESRAAQVQEGLGIRGPLISPSELNFIQLLNLESIVGQHRPAGKYCFPKMAPVSSGLEHLPPSRGNIFTPRDLLFYDSGILCPENDSGTHQCCTGSSTNLYLRFPLPSEGYGGE